MSLARRNRGFGNFTWPGFVDALASLLLVVIFVLVVLFLIQISLALRVSGQNDALDRLRNDIGRLSELLNIEREKSAAALARNEALQNTLAETAAGYEARHAETVAGYEARHAETVAAYEARHAETVAAYEARRAESEARERELAEQIATLNAEAEALNAEAEGLRRNLARETVRALTAEESSRASRAEVLALTQSLESLRDRLSRLQTLLDEKEAEARAAKEATANLTRRLNEALGSKVIELQKFRSEFFGRLRTILADRTDIRIVGDRFVFDSEVLFAPGSADIDPAGQETLILLASALREIAAKIPTEIDWVLQVSGHTDNRPISNARFRDNWDLSAARATEVLRFMIAAGIPPQRLAAAGWGEFRPVDESDTDEAHARNRRIEFTLTNR